MMTNHDQSRTGAPADPPHDADRDLATATEYLADSLGRLRQARPAFRAGLEARLVARLPEATRPWWRRSFFSAPRRAGSATVARRRALVGLAAAVAAGLSLGSVAFPLAQPPEVSANEILVKAQALAENPFLTGAKSFHLTAKSTGGLGPRRSSAIVTTEQWFVAPDRMRMESRSQGTDGKTVISGTVSTGAGFTAYGTPGSDTIDVVGVMPLPGARLPDPPKSAGDKEQGAGVMLVRAKLDGPAAGPPSDAGHIKIRALDCPPPTREGQATIAGRPVHIIVVDRSSCLPPKAPAELRGRQVTWADQETYLPLKMEHYGQDGTLVHRYEVTTIQYDVTIPDSIFTEIPPPGTTLLQMPAFPAGPGVGPAPAPAPGEKPAVIIRRARPENAPMPEPIQ